MPRRELLAAFGLGALAALLAPALPALLSDANAQALTPRRHLTCQYFEVDPAAGGLLETADQTTPAGQWIASLESSGWRVDAVDLEFSQKPTGFPVAYAQVCLERSF